MLFHTDLKGSDMGVIEITDDASCLPAELHFLHAAQELRYINVYNIKLLHQLNVSDNSNLTAIISKRQLNTR